MTRTVNDFVEDLLSDGKTEKEILIIAQNTYWKNKLAEVKEAIFKIKRHLAKKFNNE
jgi:hypothetical protein